jgi:hypothetical protein
VVKRKAIAGITSCKQNNLSLIFRLEDLQQQVSQQIPNKIMLSEFCGWKTSYTTNNTESQVKMMKFHSVEFKNDTLNPWIFNFWRVEPRVATVDNLSPNLVIFSNLTINVAILLYNLVILLCLLKLLSLANSNENAIK